MQVYLELAGRPKANVKRVALRGDTVVGRSRDCGLQIASGSVSRRHCEIRVAEGAVSVVDLGSSNGTFVDRVRVPVDAERLVPPGAHLSVGSVHFIVRYQSAQVGAEPGSTVAYEPAAPTEKVAAEPSSEETGWADASEETQRTPIPAAAGDLLPDEDDVVEDDPLRASDDEPILAEDHEPFAAPAADEAAFEFPASEDEDAAATLQQPDSRLGDFLRRLGDD